MFYNILSAQFYKVILAILMETKDKTKKEEKRVSTLKFLRMGASAGKFVYTIFGKLLEKCMYKGMLHKDTFLKMCESGTNHFMNTAPRCCRSTSTVFGI